MNNVNLLLLEQQKINKLKEYGLDKESIKEFRSKIKVVSDEDRVALGRELFELITSKSFNDENDYEKVLELIYNGADIEYKNDAKGDFVLLQCARKNYLKTFIVLLKAGANVNQKNNYLTTSTMASARHGNKEILELLILMKADINAKSLDGDNALISARFHNQVDCFYMLVKAGANLSVVSYDNRSIYTFSHNEEFESPLLKTTSKKASTKTKSSNDVNSILDEARSKLLEIDSMQELESISPQTSRKILAKALLR